MAKPLNLNTKERFKTLYTCLEINYTHFDLVHDRKWKIHFTFMISHLLFNFSTLCYTIIYHDIKLGQFGDLSRSCSMVISFLGVLSKMATVLVSQKYIKEMFMSIDDDYAVPYTEEEKQIVLKYAEKGADVCKYWLIVGTGVVLSFPSHAFLLMAYYAFIGDFQLVHMFELTLPEPIESHKNDPIVFSIFFILHLLFAVFTTITHMGFDPLVPIFMMHICGQLTLLRRRMAVLFTEYVDPKDIKQQLKFINMKLLSLYDFIEQIKTSFSLLYEFSMKTSTILLPLTAFQIIEELRNNNINFEFILIFVAGLIQFLIPCYFSDLLMEESENFRLAIYSSGWENCPEKGIRQTILFMLTRSKIPMGMRTVFYDINLDTFAEMTRQSYGILNLMNAAWS